VIRENHPAQPDPCRRYQSASSRSRYGFSQPYAAIADGCDSTLRAANAEAWVAEKSGLPVGKQAGLSVGLTGVKLPDQTGYLWIVPKISNRPIPNALNRFIDYMQRY
jgi:hypothetical protein